MEIRELLGLQGEKAFEVVHEGQILGRGGYRLGPGADKAELVGGEIEAAFRGKGLGRYLLMYRLKRISEESSVEWVEAEVPEGVVGFYAKQGFRPVRAAVDGKVRVAKRLAVCG